MADIIATPDKDGNITVDVMLLSLYPDQWMVYPYDKSKPTSEALNKYIPAKIVFDEESKKHPKLKLDLFFHPLKKVFHRANILSRHDYPQTPLYW